MEFDRYWTELSDSKDALFSIPSTVIKKGKLGMKLTDEEKETIVRNLDELELLINRVEGDTGYYPDVLVWLASWFRESLEALKYLESYPKIKKQYQHTLKLVHKYLKQFKNINLPYGLDLTPTKSKENKGFETTILSAVECLTTQLRAKPKGEIHTLSEAKDAVDRAAEKLLLGYHLEQILGLRAYKRYLEAKVK